MYKLNRQGLLFRVSDGAIIPSDVTDPNYQDYLSWVAEGNDTPVELLSLDDAKAEKLNEINNKAEKVALSLIAGYPEFEMKTWPQQEAESLAWHSDPTTPTPMIDIMATKRGIDREVYLSKTYYKTTLFRVVSSSLVGQRQRYEDMVDAASTIDQVLTINPMYSLG